MEKTLDKALDLLTALAARLGTTVEQLWPVLVRQAVAEGLMDLVVGGGIGATLAFASRWFFVRWAAVKARAEEKKDRYHEDDQRIGLVIASIVTGVAAAIILPVVVSAGILRLVNPEFYALQFLLKAIGGGK